MKYKNLFVAVFLITSAMMVHTTFAASVDTINIYSKAMTKNIKCVIILPVSYKITNNHFPVVYLLHGYSGNYADWISKVPELKNYVDEFQEIIVCPDGYYNSWYFDSPVDSTIRYETYISKEVPHYIDSAYKTFPKRNFRAICGLSMGGHGAIFIAWRHADIFGAAGSMSGLVNILQFKTRYQLINVLGDTLKNRTIWNNSTVINMVEKKPVQIPAIIFDCGISDDFIEVNRALHRKLMKLNIPHDYIERPGAHNWMYWENAVAYQLLFFKKYFSASSK